MTILVKKVFISSKPTFVYLLCPPLCGPFSIQESAAGGLSYKVKNRLRLFNSLQSPARFPRRNVRKCNVQVSRKAGFFQFKKAPQAVLPMLSECASKNSFYICIVIPTRKDSSPGTRSRSPPWPSMIFRTEESPIP